MEHTYLPKRADTASAQRPACCHSNGSHKVCSACRNKQLAGLARFTGHSLEQPARSDMEQRFGFDFSKVRIHSDAEAGWAASSMNAAAFTIGQDIVFGRGRYAPNTRTGRHLLAHELAHVVQQRNQLPRGIASHPSPHAEAEASSAALSATHGRSVGALTSQPLAVARQDGSVAPSDAGTTGNTDTTSASNRTGQVQCVIRLGGCPQSRSGGIPSSEEIAGYNTQCRQETSYTGPDVAPSDQECSGTSSLATAGTSPGSAMICSKRLEAPVLGWFFNHSYIDDTGRGDCLGASMLNNYAVQTLVSGNFVNGCAVKTDTSTDPQKFTPNVKRCDPKPGVTDVHKCLRAAFAAYSDPSEYSNDPRRKPWGPNSNTFAATLAKACCADSTSSGLGSVPGWDHSPAPPCPTTFVAGAGAAASNDGAQTDEAAT